jgi:hypothetical protein
MGLGPGIRKKKPIPDPGPGVSKAPDPGSGSATLLKGVIAYMCHLFSDCSWQLR